ncbi:unnamed protein product [Caenorhabditis nigoni]
MTTKRQVLDEYRKYAGLLCIQLLLRLSCATPALPEETAAVITLHTIPLAEEKWHCWMATKEEEEAMGGGSRR